MWCELLFLVCADKCEHVSPQQPSVPVFLYLQDATMSLIVVPLTCAVHIMWLLLHPSLSPPPPPQPSQLSVLEQAQLCTQSSRPP